MKSKAHILNHPLHPMMVALPIGLWVFSLVADVLYLLGLHADWRIVSVFCLGGGCLGAIAAAMPGIIDYCFIDDSRTKKIATWHMIVNIFLICLYGFNFYLRTQYHFEIDGAPFALSVVGIIFLGLSGWLGGDLVYVHKMGVVEERR